MSNRSAGAGPTAGRNRETIVASKQLTRTREADEQRAADRQKAAEVAQRFPGWQIFTTRDRRARVATRTGSQQPPANDTTWAATLMGDTWQDLEQQLAAQAEHDAEGTAP